MADNAAAAFDSGRPLGDKATRSWLLDPAGLYRVRGVLARSIRRNEARWVDSDTLRPSVPMKNDSDSLASLMPALVYTSSALTQVYRKGTELDRFDPLCTTSS